jgi:hypothetical protein
VKHASTARHPREPARKEWVSISGGWTLNRYPAPRGCDASDYGAKSARRAVLILWPEGHFLAASLMLRSFSRPSLPITRRAQNLRRRDLTLAKLAHEIIVRRFSCSWIIRTALQIPAARMPFTAKRANAYAWQPFQLFTHNIWIDLFFKRSRPAPLRGAGREPSKNATPLVRWSDSSIVASDVSDPAVFHAQITSSCLHRNLDSHSTLRLPSPLFAQSQKIARTTGVSKELISLCTF